MIIEISLLPTISEVFEHFLYTQIWAVSQSGIQSNILIQIGYFTKFFTAAHYLIVRRVSTMVA